MSLTTQQLREMGWEEGPNGIARKIVAPREPVGAVKNYEDRNNSPSSSPESECPVWHDALAEAQGETKDSRRVSVSVTSYRKRLTDPDNLCPKYFVDLCRYSGLIRDDSAKEIDFRCSQEKVQTKAEERTLITIESP